MKSFQKDEKSNSQSFINNNFSTNETFSSKNINLNSIYFGNYFNEFINNSNNKEENRYILENFKENKNVRLTKEQLFQIFLMFEKFLENNYKDPDSITAKSHSNKIPKKEEKSTKKIIFSMMKLQ